MATRRYVRESGNGWEVLAEGQRRSALQADSRSKALAQARAIVRKHGGGEVRVLNDVGKIVSSDKVRPKATKPTGAKAKRK
jgi:hypothetical protein